MFYNSSSDLDKILTSLVQLKQISIGFLVAAAVVLAARMYTRGAILGRYQMDDWFACFAWACAAVGTSMDVWESQLVAATVSGGLPNATALSTLLKTDSTMYIGIMVGIKLSLSCFLLRIFTVQKVQRHIVWGSTGVFLVASIFFLVAVLDTCGVTRPFNGQTCALYDLYGDMLLIWSWINAISTLVLCALAFSALYKAQLPGRTKMYTYMILAAGTCGGLASLVRILIFQIYRNELENGTSLILKASYITQVEIFVGQVSISLVCLRPLLRKFGSKIGPSLGTSRNGTTGTSTARSKHTSREQSTLHSKPTADDIYGLNTVNIQITATHSKDRAGTHSEEEQGPGITTIRNVTVSSVPADLEKGQLEDDQ